MIRIRKKSPCVAVLLLAAASLAAVAQTNEPISTNFLRIHLSQRGGGAGPSAKQCLKGKADLRASYGIEIQCARWPSRNSRPRRLQCPGGIARRSLSAAGASAVTFSSRTKNWSADVKVQSHLPGRRLTRISLGQIDAPTGAAELSNCAGRHALSVRIAYDDVLVAAQEIAVTKPGATARPRIG